MAEPIYTTLLGLYLSAAEYRKHVKPGQTVYVWMPPHLERVSGKAAAGWVAGQTETILVVKLDDGGMVEVNDNNVWLFQPA